MLEMEKVFEVKLCSYSHKNIFSLPTILCNMLPLLNVVDIQITCSPTIQDPIDELNMFEVSPTNDVIVPALVELITHYKWRKLALIVETKQEYSHEVNMFTNWLY